MPGSHSIHDWDKELSETLTHTNTEMEADPLPEPDWVSRKPKGKWKKPVENYLITEEESYSYQTI